MEKNKFSKKNNHNALKGSAAMPPICGGMGLLCNYLIFVFFFMPSVTLTRRSMFLDAFGCLLLLTKINEQIFSNFLHE